MIYFTFNTKVADLQDIKFKRIEGWTLMTLDKLRQITDMAFLRDNWYTNGSMSIIVEELPNRSNSFTARIKTETSSARDFNYTFSGGGWFRGSTAHLNVYNRPIKATLVWDACIKAEDKNKERCPG